MRADVPMCIGPRGDAVRAHFNFFLCGSPKAKAHNYISMQYKI